MTTTEPSLGVLGGMGPAATADFLTRLVHLTPAASDQEHIATIVYSDPRTPDRSDAILGHGPSPLPAMIRGIDFLNRAGCAVIAIPCNTAYYWHADLAERSETPILHIVDATADQLRRLGNVSTVGVIATHGTTHAGIYAAKLEAAGINALDLADLGEQGPQMQGIRAMKGGRAMEARSLLHDAGKELVRRGAEALVLGCTDASAAMAGIASLAGVRLLDAADCLARAAIDKLGRHSR
jgi:aspartate racemase